MFGADSFKRTIELITYRSGGDKRTQYVSPGQAKCEPVTLERGISHDAAFEECAKLELFEEASDPVVTEVCPDREHVGPVDEVPVLDAGHAEDESDDVSAPVECAGGDAADALGDLEDGGGYSLAESGTPDPVLELDAGDELFVGREVAHSDVDVRSCDRHIAA